MKAPVIGFAGLSHLGLCSAVAAAEKRFPTIAWDGDADLVTALGDGGIPVTEPDLPELIAANKERLTFAVDAAALAACDVVYIARDVPTDDAGNSDLAPIIALIERVVPVLRPDAALVILSQVPPGFTRSLGNVCRHLYCQVETLVFGRAMERALNPDRLIVGGADPARSLPSAYAQFLDAFHCPVLPMRYESAELSKIAINCFLVASFTTANTLAELCEKLDADWSEIAPALRLDKRIGPHAYLKPGLGIAGGNLERDLTTVLALSRTHHTDAGTVESWIADSRRRRGWVLARLKDLVLSRTPDPVIAVWGLAYKENTASTKNAPSLALLEMLGDHRVRAFDPVAAADLPGPNMARVPSAMAAAEGADVLVVMTPWPEFGRVAPADLARTMAGRVIIDPYGMVDATAARAAGFDYARLGRTPAPAVRATA